MRGKNQTQTKGKLINHLTPVTFSSINILCTEKTTIWVKTAATAKIPAHSFTLKMSYMNTNAFVIPRVIITPYISLLSPSPEHVQNSSHCLFGYLSLSDKI